MFFDLKRKRRVVRFDETDNKLFGLFVNYTNSVIQLRKSLPLDEIELAKRIVKFAKNQDYATAFRLSKNLNENLKNFPVASGTFQAFRELENFYKRLTGQLSLSLKRFARRVRFAGIDKQKLYAIAVNEMSGGLYTRVQDWAQKAYERAIQTVSHDFTYFARTYLRRTPEQLMRDLCFDPRLYTNYVTKLAKKAKIDVSEAKAVLQQVAEDLTKAFKPYIQRFLANLKEGADKELEEM